MDEQTQKVVPFGAGMALLATAFVAGGAASIVVQRLRTRRQLRKLLDEK